ncbi:hypothetical protein KIN20_001940 [Parelaphostrongylus tenuis]|uniref:Uncharacterized protein n=1 Tax=Parelaphostrongylus tenuis TaxID=148309 RepID=A0AAD5QD60_PARTN|nr:hypothetical protein KIN20_001940 [Parelaphostrongylus tenuis]
MSDESIDRHQLNIRTPTNTEAGRLHGGGGGGGDDGDDESRRLSRHSETRGCGVTSANTTAEYRYSVTLVVVEYVHTERRQDDLRWSVQIIDKKSGRDGVEADRGDWVDAATTETDPRHG